MASAPKIEQVDTVLQIDPNDIDTSRCIGLFFPEWSQALGKLMKADGQRQPIGVTRNGPRASKSWTLTFGRHRVEGALGEQLPFVRAIIDDGGDASQASENIDRRHLGPIEHALFVRSIADAAEARVKREHGDLSPQEIGIRKRWDAMKAKAPGVEREAALNEADADHTSANFARVYGWAEETAEILGMSRRALYNALALHRAIIAPFPGLYEALARHPQVGENASALREIASFGLEARRALIEGLIDPHVTLVGGNRVLTPPAEMAAACAVIAARELAIDPALPLTGIVVPGVVAPRIEHRFQATERELLLRDGISTFTVTSSGEVAMERMISTYQTNDYGLEDVSYLDITTLSTLAYYRFSWRARMRQKFPRAKLTDDIITAVRAETIALARDWYDAGLMEDVNGFIAGLIIERDTTNRTQLNFKLTPDVINGLLQFAASIEFKL